MIKIVGEVYRESDSQTIMIPVRYFENRGVATDRSKVAVERTMYEPGKITDNLNQDDLQLEIVMNARDRASGCSFISRHKDTAIKHTTDRWHSNVMGKYSVGRGGEVE